MTAQILSLGTTTYICDFHREQAWERWLRKADNGLNEHREEVLHLLRNVAKSSTEDAYHDNLTSLKTSELWLSNPQLRNWFEKTWLPEAKVPWNYCKTNKQTKRKQQNKNYNNNKQTNQPTRKSLIKTHDEIINTIFC